MIPKNHPLAGIRRLNRSGGEFWHAREVAPWLDYTNFGDFWSVIKKAEQGYQNCLGHFWHIKEKVGALGHKKHWQRDVLLSDRGLRSVVMAADSAKPVVSLCQLYYAAFTFTETLAANKKQAGSEVAGENLEGVDFRGVAGFKPIQRILAEPPASTEELESYGSIYVMLSQIISGVFFKRSEAEMQRIGHNAR